MVSKRSLQAAQAGFAKILQPKGYQAKNNKPRMSGVCRFIKFTIVIL